MTAVREAFEAARNPVRAAAMSAYMRGQFPYFGLANPERVTVERTLVLASPAPTGPDEIRQVALGAWELPEREFQYFGVDYLRRHLALVTPALLPTLRHLIITRSWWDTVDGLATHITGELVRRHPELRSSMDDWIASDNIWLVRTALLHQERYKHQTDPDLLFAYCVRRAGDREFFVRKAMGWALRSYAKTDPDAVAAFLERHGRELSGLTRREADRGIALGRR